MACHCSQIIQCQMPDTQIPYTLEVSVTVLSHWKLHEVELKHSSPLH